MNDRNKTEIGHRWFVVLAIIWIAANVLNSEFMPILGKPRIYILGLLPLFIAWVLVRLVRHHGVRGMMLRVTPTLMVLLVVEVAFQVYYRAWASPEQIAELATQTAENFGTGPIYTPHHYSIYNPSPGLRLADGLTHNSLGFRDSREFLPDSEAIRIVFIGGSTTYTVHLRDNAKIFSSGLEKKLNSHYQNALEGRRIEVINAGMGSATSAENLIRLIFFVSEVQPDVIIIQHGLNDVAPRAVGGVTTDYSNYRKSWSTPSIFQPKFSIAYSLTLKACLISVACDFVVMRSGLAKNWHLMQYTAQTDGSDELAANLSSNGPQYFIRNTRYMIAFGKEMGAEVVLATVPFTEKTAEARAVGTSEHNRLLLQLGEQLGIPVYDFAAAMVLDDAHLPDGVHVSQLGSDLKRDLYFDYLVQEDVIGKILVSR
jgi:lysophospholipase L1-like esterase